MHLFVEYARQFGRFQRNARLYLISNALGGVTVGIFLVLYNLYLVALGYATDFIGLVVLVATLGVGLGIFPAGICFDRFGGKPVLIWSSVLIGLAGTGQIIFRQPIPLLLTGFIAGVAGAALLVVNAPFLTANSTPDERPHLFSLVIVISLVTTVLGEVLGGALPLWFRATSWLMAPLPPWLAWLLAGQLNARSYQLALLFAGVIAGPSFIPLFLMSNDRPPAVRRRERTPFVQSIAPLAVILHSPFLLLILVQVLIGLGAGLFIPYFNIYFVQHLGASSAVFGLIDGGANTINALLTLAAPWLAMRIGKINTITFTRLISIPLLLTIGLTSTLPLAAILYLFRQGMMDMSLGVFQVFSMEAVPEQHRGLANSSYQASFQVAWALAASLGGFIIVHFGYSPVFIMGATLYMLAIATLWGRFGRGREKQFGEPGIGQTSASTRGVESSSKELLRSWSE